MRIGIDISQIVYEGTGVGKYMREMVKEITRQDHKNEFVLFGSSLRKRDVFFHFYNTLPDHKRVTLRVFPFPPTILSILWNTLHIVPAEWLIGAVDVFWSSDWTQPPLARAKAVTTIHDLIALKYPEETHAVTEIHGTSLQISPNIVSTHKRRLSWVKRECSAIFCDSIATKQDCMELLGIPEQKLHVVYPGYSV